MWTDLSWQVSKHTAFKVSNSLQQSNISTIGHTTAIHFPAHYSKSTNFPLTVTLLPAAIPLSHAFLHSTLKVLHSFRLSHICTGENSTTKCDPAHYSQNTPLPSVAITVSIAFQHTTLKVHSSLQMSCSPICVHTSATYIPTHQSQYMQFLSTVIHCYQWPYHLQMYSCTRLSECTVPFWCHSRSHSFLLTEIWTPLKGSC
jgi:hypothetical protein